MYNVCIGGVGVGVGLEDGERVYEVYVWTILVGEKCEL